MNSWISKFLAFALVLFGLCAPQIAAAADRAVDAKPLFLGMHIHRAAKAPWPQFPFGSWRLWDAGVSWRDMQRDPGGFEFKRLDGWVDLAEARGVELIYAFGVTPVWASARPEEAGAYGPGSAAEPARMEDWRQYVRAVVTRYKGRIRNYEVWNEPNWKNFYSGNWTELANLVREVSLIVKEVDPTARVILPALASDHGLSVIDDFLRTGVGKYVDVVAYHFYTGHRPPEVMFGMAGRLKESMRKAGLEAKPIWNTEFGWLVEGQGRRIDPAVAGFAAKAPVYSDDVAASFVVRAFVILASQGIERSYFYAWDNESMGAYDPKTERLKPGMVAAFGTVGRWLGSRTPQCTRPDARVLCKLGPSDAAGTIAWIEKGALDGAALKAEWRTAEDVTGKVLDLSADGASVTLGQGPYLLRK
jgi:hypothetical protein